jgi:hypothetical protein
MVADTASPETETMSTLGRFIGVSGERVRPGGRWMRRDGEGIDEGFAAFGDFGLPVSGSPPLASQTYIPPAAG